MTVNIVDENGDTVNTYALTANFNVSEYAFLKDTLRCSYSLTGDTLTVDANANVNNIYLVFAPYGGETLTVTNDVGDCRVVHNTATGYRIYKGSSGNEEFDAVFSAPDVPDRVIHVVVNF